MSLRRMKSRLFQGNLLGHRSRKAAFEYLQDRCMLSVNVAFDPTHGLLTIRGDDNSDSISVSSANIGGSNYVQITANGNDVSPGVSCSAVKFIAVTTGSGNDTIDLSTVTRDAYTFLEQTQIDSGNGGDIIYGSNAAPAFQIGDVNLSGGVDGADISPMMTALTNQSGYLSNHPGLSTGDALYILDVNRDGFVTNADLQALLNCLRGTNSFPLDNAIFGGPNPKLSIDQLGNVNHAPTLGPINDQSGMVGTTISFQASATDPDPGQRLTYSLFGDIPTCATISPSGLFTWTPTSAQAGTNYTIGVQVTDNGSTHLSDSVLFNVWADPIPRPTGLHAAVLETIGGGGIFLQWQTANANNACQVQRRLMDGGDWQTVGTGTQSFFDGITFQTLLQEGTTYQYRVALTIGSQLSAYSDPVTVTTRLLPCIPTAIGLEASGVRIFWQYGGVEPLTAAVLGFYVERYNSPAEGWVRAGTVGPGNPGSTGWSYLDPYPQATQSSLYRVRAYTADAIGDVDDNPDDYGTTITAGSQRTVVIDVAGADDLGTGLARTIPLNDNFDEQNHDSQGNLIGDNQPDYAHGDRIAQPPFYDGYGYSIDDQQLVFGKLDLKSFSFREPFQLTLTFPSNIKIWATPGRYQPYVQVQNGVTYDASSYIPSAMNDHGFYIEGISPGEADITATASENGVTASYTVKLFVVGADSLTLTEDSFQSNTVTATDQTYQPNLHVLEDANKQSVVDLQYNAPSLPAGTQVLWSAYGEGNDTAMSGAFTGNTATLTLTRPKDGTRYFIGVGVDLNGNGVLEPNEVDRQANVFLIPQLQVQYTAFIMQQWVDNPLDDDHVTIFKGDSRTDAAGRAIFDNNNNNYRDRENFTIIPTQIHDADGIKDGSFTPSVGETFEYYKPTSVDANGNLVANPEVLAHAFANKDSMIITAQQRPNPYTVVVKIDSAPHNPLVVPEALSPNIDFHVTLTIDYSNPDAPKYTITGSFDGFPCTELYINNQPIIEYDSTAHGKGPAALFGIGSDTININKTGYLHP